MRQSLDALLKPVLFPDSPSPSTPTLDSTVPTLLLFECVLAYMQPEESNAILQWFADHFTGPGATLAGVVYEMFMLNDPFGRVMLNNMKVYIGHLPYTVIITSELIFVLGPERPITRCCPLHE
jgi:[phosphatase 2A protein]-leucine-carboxy methyltransferase